MTPTPLRDPSGLLARSPELAPLAERAPALRRAIEKGKPHEAYRALYWAHKLGKLGDQAAVAASLLARRRIFFKPLGGTPAMITFNGVGTSLYGRSDHDPADQTYVATLFAVVVFVPIFPLASYLVRDASGGRLRRSWNFLAKVPLGGVAYLWQRAVALGALAVVGFGLAHATEGYGHGTLHVVNGLDRPLHVEIAGKEGASGDALPRRILELRTAVGKHPLTIRDRGRVVESAMLDVPRGRDALVWNVLGAPPVELETVVYASSGASPDAPPPPELLCGQSFWAKGGVDDVFRDPPKEVSHSSHEESSTRRHLRVGDGGLRTCLRYLLTHGRAADASRLAFGVARGEQLDAAHLPEGFEAALMAAPPAEAESFLKDLLERDDSVPAHRLYQGFLKSQKLLPRAIAEYDARLVAHPNDPDAEYLALRIKPDEEEHAKVDALVERFPAHAYLRRVQFHVHFEAHEYDVAIRAAEALHTLDDAMWGSDAFERHVEALLAAGRGRDALALTHAAALEPSPPGPSRQTAELLGYRVGHAIDDPQKLPIVANEDEAHVAALLFQAQVGDEVSAPEIELVTFPDAKEALRMVRAARTNPVAACELAKQSHPEAFGILPAPVRMLLLGEASRRGLRELAEQLDQGWLPAPVLEDVVAYVGGASSDESTNGLPLEAKAALDFVRSRNTALSPEVRSAALKQAKQEDVFRGPVSLAIAQWPAP